MTGITTNESNNLHLLITINNKCNLSCKYCSPDKICISSSKSKMELNVLDSLINTGLTGQKRVTFVWRRKEPLLRGLPFFEKIIEKQKKYNRTTFIKNIIQTNLTLFNDKWAEFIVKNKLIIGFSYDGKSAQDITRSKTQKIVFNNMRILQKSKISSLGNIVVTKYNYKNIFEIIQEFESLNLDFDISLATNYQDKDYNMFLTQEEWAEVVINVFNAWLNGKVNKNTFCERLLKTLIRNQNNSNINCEPQFCHRNHFVINSNGDIYTRDKFLQGGDSINNVQTINNFSEVSGSSQVDEIIKTISFPYECTQCKWSSLCGINCPKKEEKDSMCQANKLIYSSLSKTVQQLYSK